MWLFRLDATRRWDLIIYKLYEILSFLLCICRDLTSFVVPKLLAGAFAPIRMRMPHWMLCVCPVVLMSGPVVCVCVRKLAYIFGGIIMSVAHNAMLSVRHFLISVAYAKLSFWNYYEIQIRSYRNSCKYAGFGEPVRNAFYRDDDDCLNREFRLSLLLPSSPLPLSLLRFNSIQNNVRVCVQGMEDGGGRSRWWYIANVFEKTSRHRNGNTHTHNWIELWHRHVPRMLKAIMSHASAYGPACLCVTTTFACAWLYSDI